MGPQLIKVLQSSQSLLGVLIKDWWRYQRALNAGGEAYLTLCNRYEYLEPAPDGSGYQCDWQWTSELHAPSYLPNLGLKLLRHALALHPIRRLPQPKWQSNTPAISFLIGHRGEERLPHLLATLESIAGQRDVALECLVIEQDRKALLPGNLPDWVRHVHTLPSADIPYCRAWAFNVGARLARGRMLVLHDNDILVPTDYAASILERSRQGWEAINLKRFIFFLAEDHTKGIFAGIEALIARPPQTIMQNSEAGGSIAISREAYQRIGGMDEGFIGWGGEDNEFWERTQTLMVWPYGYLPMVHLWHYNQPGKYQADNPSLHRYLKLSKIPVDERIAYFRSIEQGNRSGPSFLNIPNW